MRKIAIVLLGVFMVAAVNAQVNIKTIQKDFENGEYASVIAVLEKAMAKNDRDARQNYYLGASYVQTGQNYAEAIRRLKFSILKKYVADAHYYLGVAYQTTYEYELAEREFAQFLQQPQNMALVPGASEALKQCKYSIPLASKLYNIRVIDKYAVAKEELLTVYNPSKEAGTLMHNRDFFSDTVDPNLTLYRTERGDAVYFVMTADNGKNSLYRMEQLLDGWSDATVLNIPGLSEGNAVAPVLLTDGVTLYFASDQEGGMGGLDIYKTVYDASSRTFSTPQNLGVPFNSPADDYLFVPDESQQRAWFASTREVSADSVMVYEVLWDNSVIRSFAQSTDEIRLASALNIDESLKGMRKAYNASSTTAATVSNSDKSVTRRRNEFVFQLNDTLRYTHSEHFRSAEALQLFRGVNNLTKEADSLRMQIASWRKEFMAMQNDADRNDVIQKIIKVERRVYEIDDILPVEENKVRIVEIQELQNQLASGTYTPLNAIKTKPREFVFDWDKILRPDDFTMFTPSFFDVDARKYAGFFTPSQREELLEADSLLAWCQIMTVECAKLNEKVLNGGANEKIEERLELLQVAQATLLNRQLDRKADIIDDRLEELCDRDHTVDYTEVKEIATSALHQIKMVESITLGDGVDQYVKAAMLKQRSVKLLMSAADRLQAHVNGSFPLPSLHGGAVADAEKAEPEQKADADDAEDEKPQRESVVAKAEVKEPEQKVNVPEQKSTVKEPEQKAEVIEPEKSRQSVEKPVQGKAAAEAAETVAQPQAKLGGYAMANAEKGVFRIQLGVFRNTPDAVKLAKVGVVTVLPIPDKGLTKYYAGAYKSREEAAANLAQVHAAGFKGAFVVGF